MTDKTPPPRRNYQQMVRVVRDGDSKPVPYQLAKAYGEPASNPTETRERSLDEIGINSRTSRQPEAPGNDGYLPTRESTTLYHELSPEQQQYFDGTTPNPAPTRQDGWPGTKSRAYLGGDAEHVTITPPGSGEKSHKKEQREEKADTSRSRQHSQTDTGDFSPLPPAPHVKKQTKLPIVKRPSLKGTKGTDIGFDI